MININIEVPPVVLVLGFVMIVIATIFPEIKKTMKELLKALK